MTDVDISRWRLHSQWISHPAHATPADVVSRLASVQAQDYAGAKWALGLRIHGAIEEELDRAFAEGAILRTHLLRPTWHFVTPADIRWLLALTAPRVHAANAHMVRKVGLDSAVFGQCEAALAQTLQGGHYRTREELAAVLRQAGVDTGDGLRMSYLMMHAELEGVVCSGPRRGKQFTYALLDERAPQARSLARPDALAELARRYFTSRGPATVQDLAKWSGLTIADARAGLAAVEHQLQHEALDGQTYWFADSQPAPEAAGDGPPVVHLLSIYDEYISGYKDRSAMVDAETFAKLMAMGAALGYILVVDGRVVGSWRRTLRRDGVIIETNPFVPLTKAQQAAVAAAAQHYGRFLNRPVVLTTR